jgi:hypothetical protein
MQIPGHLAVAVAESHLPLFRRGPRRLLILLFVASLFPDGPWFFPLKKYPFKKGRLKFDPAQLLGETVILLLVLILSRKRDFFHKKD